MIIPPIKPNHMEAIDCEIKNRDGDTIIKARLCLHNSSSGEDQILLLLAVRPKSRPLTHVED